MSTDKQHEKEAKKTANLHKQIDPALKARAQEAANDQRRSLSNWVDIAIEEKLERDRH